MAIGGNEVVAQFLGLAVESDRRDNDKHNEKLQNDICVIKNDGPDCLGANAQKRHLLEGPYDPDEYIALRSLLFSSILWRTS